MNRKLKVGILFGGKSAEHEISLLSAKNVFEAIDRDKYEPVLIGIDKSGRWLLNEGSNFIINPNDPRLIRLNPSSEPIALVPQSEGAISNLSNGNIDRAVDVVFPILHGPFGEDGTIQGLLKLADIPFVGAGVLASAVSMDKDVMKRLLRDAGLPIGEFWTVRPGDKIPDYEEICAKLGSPFFIKPANMGSSVGISKIHNKENYLPALDNAFEYDSKILIEEFIPGRELECSVLGNEGAKGTRIEVSAIGEIKPKHEFYSYDAKYIDEDGAELIIPASLPVQIIDRTQELSRQVYKALCCEGLARVDFFLKEDNSILVNEINTMPGFTRISMYPKLWEASGLSYTRLIDRLIELALMRFEKEKKLKTSV